MKSKLSILSAAIALAVANTAIAAEIEIPAIPSDALTVTKSTDLNAGAYWQNGQIGDNLQGNIHFVGDAALSGTGHSNALAMLGNTGYFAQSDPVKRSFYISDSLG